VYVLVVCLILLAQPVRMYLNRMKFNKNVQQAVETAQTASNNKNFKEYVEFCLRLNDWKSPYVPTYDIFVEWMQVHEEFRNDVAKLKQEARGVHSS
jgi:hypothetical protein